MNVIYFVSLCTQYNKLIIKLQVFFEKSIVLKIPYLQKVFKTDISGPHQIESNH